MRIVLGLLVFIFFNSFSVNAFDINGQVKDEKNMPIEFANITLFRINDSLPYQNTVTDSLGTYEFTKVDRGNYWIEISYIGYTSDSLFNIDVQPKIEFIQLPDRIDTLFLEQLIEIPTIVLKLEGKILDGVTITANKPIYERKADRIIFNVENSVYSQGGDAMQALSKAPRVQVQNNEIKIAGCGTAAVLINDRIVHMSGEELSQYLRSIPSNDIAKIEVIPNPPAKYDAQGAALINIVLKKNRKQGYNGSVTGNFEQAQYQGGSLGATFNYTKKKVSLNSSITNQVNKFYREETHILRYTDQIWKDTAINPQLSNSIFGRFGLNIDIKDKNILGFNYNGTWNKVFWDKELITTRVHDNINNNLLQSIINNANTTRNFYNHSFTTYYTLQIDTTGKKLDIGFDFFNGYRNINRNYTNAIFNGSDSLLSQTIPQENTNGKQKSYIYAINTDMEHPVKYGTWQYGAKFTYFNVRSNN